MKLNDNILIVYDIEVLLNIFTCTVYNTETNELITFEISERKDNTIDIIRYFQQLNVYFVGYNNIHFDNPIINYIILYFNNNKYTTLKKIESLFNMSQIIINEDSIDKWKQFKYANLFKTIDLLTMLFSQGLRVSLKEMQVTMMYKKVQEMVIDWNKALDNSLFDTLISYNINDVFSTYELLKICKKDIELRISIEKEYGVYCLSQDGVGIGSEILKLKYLEATGLKWQDIKDLRSPMPIIALKDVILPFIDYDTPILKDLLNRLKTYNVSPERKGLEEQFIYEGNKISIGVGGIHSINKPEVIIPKEDELLLDTDAASLYPTLLIEYGFYPKHLGSSFIDIYKQIRTERIEAKHLGNKSKDTTLKLALNAVTGNLQNEYSWLYSPFAVMQIRMNGQLLLLKLAEKLIAINCKIIQYNTDGLFLICKKNRKDEYDAIIKEFEQFSRLTMETTEFKAMYQYAINDYLAIPIKGEPKTKGLFIYDLRLGKGLGNIIRAKALKEYFINKIPIEYTIKNHTDIKDFLLSQKVNKDFKVEWNNKIQQHTNRFYVSKKGAYLYKYKDLFGKRKYTSLISGYGVELFNDYIEKPIKEYNIDYSYYISETRKIIEEMEPKQLTLF